MNNLGSTTYVGATSKSGRAGIALPLNAVVGIASLGTAIIILAISMVIWPIMIFWHEVCWGVLIVGLIIWARKIVRSYKEGRS